jgi:amino-acid N-acetyltransferase
MKPTDLRGILHYIPQFRDRVFIIAVDGAVVADDNFGNILLDVAVLRSLNIQVVLVHGAGHQVKQFADQLNESVTSHDGTGVTDPATLRIASMASQHVTHEILEGLSLNNLRAAQTNCVEAVPLGIIKGVDHQKTGKVHRVDITMLKMLLEKEIIPVISPLGFDGNGNTYRLNSDAVAVEVARALGAVKLMYITTRQGLEIDGQLITQVSAQELDSLVKTSQAKLAPDMVSKAQHALNACAGGVNRVHIISGQVDEGLLAEVFSNEGIGTLIYTNEYQAIRQAMRKDIRNIMTLIKPAVAGDQIVKRTRASIEKQINHYYVFEIDKNICGVFAVVPYPDLKRSELACLQVSPAHQHRGVGSKMAVYAERVARDQGGDTIFCLSTQAFTFFQHKLGYTEGAPDDLPPSRREKYEQSGRNSKILVKRVANPVVPSATTPPLDPTAPFPTNGTPAS